VASEDPPKKKLNDLFNKIAKAAGDGLKKLSEAAEGPVEEKSATFQQPEEPKKRFRSPKRFQL